MGTFATAGFTCKPENQFCISIGGEYSLPSLAKATYGYNPWEIPVFILLGIWCAIFALIISYTISFLQRFRMVIYGRSHIWKLIDVFVVFMLTAIALSLLTLGAQCDSFENLAIEPSTVLTISTDLCSSPNHYNPIALILLENRSVAIGAVFAPSIISIATLAISGTAALIFTSITNGLFIPSGLFIPLVLVGSIWGRCFGNLVALGIGSVVPGVYAIAGAAGVLAGVNCMTIWIAAVILEASSDIDLAIPVMITIIVSKWICDALMKSDLCHRQMNAKGWKFLQPAQSDDAALRLSGIPIAALMTHPVVCLREVEKKYVVENILLFSNHSLYPVVDREGRFIGTTQRRDLESLIESIQSPSESITIPVYTNTLSVYGDFDSRKCYYLFTQLGTKIVVVVGRDNCIVGVVSRQNFLAQKN
jgi:CBS domain-containing protein